MKVKNACSLKFVPSVEINIPNIPRTVAWAIFYIHSSGKRNEVVQQLIEII